MPLLATQRGQVYRPYVYPHEKAFERAVVALADHIFGASTLYIDTKKKIKGSGITTIPDGYVIDMADPDEPKLFYVEIERKDHDPLKHIGRQLLGFVTSFDEGQYMLRKHLIEAITSKQELVDRLRVGCERSSSRNIDNYLDRAVYGNFRCIVVIDEARPELHRVLEKINANISVLEVKAFVGEDGNVLHHFDTLYDEFADEFGTIERATKRKRAVVSPEVRARWRARRTQSDTIVVAAREEGFQREFLGAHRWYAIRIGAAMKERIQYIAAYQVAPVSAITHIARVAEIRPYKDTGKYLVAFEGPPEEIGPIPLKKPNSSPQGPIYVKRSDLLTATHLEDCFDGT